MGLCDSLLDHVVKIIQAVPMAALAVYAAVALVTAGMLYLLLDARRYRAIPELNVPLTPGDCDSHSLRCLIAQEKALTLDLRGLLLMVGWDVFKLQRNQQRC